jgi:uncharacterized lipoprotein YehR (DUF1307 family)
MRILLLMLLLTGCDNGDIRRNTKEYGINMCKMGVASTVEYYAKTDKLKTDIHEIYFLYAKICEDFHKERE